MQAHGVDRSQAIAFDLGCGSGFDREQDAAQMDQLDRTPLSMGRSPLSVGSPPEP